jgi:shikimate kinase
MALRPFAQLIYLRVSAATAARRLAGAARERPLLSKGDPEQELEKLLAMRRDLYETADLVVDTEAIGIPALTTYIAGLARGSMAESG